MSIYTTVYLFTYVSMYLCIYLFIYLSIYLLIYLSIYVCIHPSISYFSPLICMCMSINLSLSKLSYSPINSVIRLYTYPSPYLHVHGILCASIHAFINRSIMYVLYCTYSQIIRFMPRFTVINKLDVCVKIMQPTGFGGDSITLPLTAQHLNLYHLPDIYADRKISIQPEGPWSRTVAFNIDEIGALTLAIKRKQYLASLPHVVTRSSPEYSVLLPPQEIGLYLETDFFDKSHIVVKGFRADSYALINTNIQVIDITYCDII